MNTNNDGWIKMSERKPTNANGSIWLYSIYAEPGYAVVHTVDCSAFQENPWTHWKPAVLPAPPAKELTQREKDDKEGRLYALGMPGSSVAIDVWHAALAYRDAQNREDIEALHGVMLGHVSAPYSNLRRRCGLDT